MSGGGMPTYSMRAATAIALPIAYTPMAMLMHTLQIKIRRRTMKRTQFLLSSTGAWISTAAADWLETSPTPSASAVCRPVVILCDVGL